MSRRVVPLTSEHLEALRLPARVRPATPAHPSYGLTILVDERPAGFATYELRDVHTARLTALWIQPDARGCGLGRFLVQRLAAELVSRETRSLEATGRYRRDRGIPADFLVCVGFRTVRPHPTRPRLRMDLTSTATWRDEIEEIWARLVQTVRPHRVPVPRPTHYAASTQRSAKQQRPATRKGDGALRGT